MCRVICQNGFKMEREHSVIKKIVYKNNETGFLKVTNKHMFNDKSNEINYKMFVAVVFVIMQHKSNRSFANITVLRKTVNGLT